ncbi:MAG: hypothetical protein ACREA4_00085 [Nitrososphaera sp.]
MKERSQGRPAAPKNQESDSPRPHEESKASNSLVSPVEQKLSDKLSPTSSGEKQIEKAGFLSKMRGKIGGRRAVFDCIVQRIIPSPSEIPLMFEGEDVSQ